MNNSQRDFEIFGVTGYTVMSTYHLRDKNLSLKAKGLLSMMLSLPKDWDYSIKGLVAISKEGEYSITSIIDELKHYNYIKIDKYKNDLGQFRYKYNVYYLPYEMYLKMHNHPEVGFPGMDNPVLDNHDQLNIDNKKDKYDNKGLYNDNHNILTNNLIKKEYVSDDSSDLFLYDDLFNRLLDENNTFENLSLITNYILNNIKSRNYLDENDEPIKNRFGYFKNAIISNLNRFKSMEEQNEIFEYDWLNDDELEI